MEHILVSKIQSWVAVVILILQMSNSHLASFFSRSDLRIPTYFVRPASIRVYNTSRIRYATRVNFDVACNMNFKSFPGDTQVRKGNLNLKSKFRFLIFPQTAKRSATSNSNRSGTQRVR